MESTSKVTLREASRPDAEAVAEIWRLGWRDGHLGLVPRELVEARTEDSFRARASERIDEMTVAVVDGAIAGFVLVVDDEVEQVYVAASHRGTGVAPALLSEAERQVRANGHSRPGWRSSPAMHEPVPSTNERDGGTTGRSSTPPPPRAGRSTSPAIGTRSSFDDARGSTTVVRHGHSPEASCVVE
jgi:GNAT superfamily N-acetyltransferase